MKLVHKSPCSECPFRRISAPGWLGAATPLEFIVNTESDVSMPCHKSVNYERRDWRKQAESGPRCAGSLIYLRNSFKMPIDADLRAARDAVKPDHAIVFSNRGQFLEHHESED